MRNDKRHRISSEYQEYLTNPNSKWQKIRETVLLRDEFRCRLCGAKKDVQVHHIRYAHVFHEEDHLEDLMVLCEVHHRMITQYWKIVDSIKEYYEQKRHQERMRRGLY